MIDETENYRRARFAELNAQADIRAELEKRYGKVWSTEELRADYEVIGFGAPYVVVRRKATGQTGSMEFQHSPRLYFNWQEDK